MGSSAGGEQSAIQPPVKVQLAKRPPSPAGPPPSEVVPDDMPEEELVMPEEEPGDVPDAPNGGPDEEPDDAPDGEPNEEPEVDPLDAPARPPCPGFAPVPAHAPSANKAARPDPPPSESHRMRRNEGSLRTAVIKVSAPRIVAATENRAVRRATLAEGKRLQGRTSNRRRPTRYTLKSRRSRVNTRDAASRSARTMRVASA